MFKNEIRNDLKTIYNAKNNIDNEIIKIKVALHDLEKKGIKIPKKLEKEFEDFNIYFYKLKMLEKEFEKELL